MPGSFSGFFRILLKICSKDKNLESCQDIVLILIRTLTGIQERILSGYSPDLDQDLDRNTRKDPVRISSGSCAGSVQDFSFRILSEYCPDLDRDLGRNTRILSRYEQVLVQDPSRIYTSRLFIVALFPENSIFHWLLVH